MIRWLCILLMPFLLACSSSTHNEKKGYVIAQDPLWYPLSLPGKEAYLSGYTSDLFQKIGAMEAFEVNIVEASWDNLLFGLENQRYDAIVSSLPPIVAYLDQFSFSEVYLELGPQLIVKKKSTISDMIDLEEKEVGVLSGAMNDINLLEVKSINIQFFDNYTSLLEGVQNGLVDAVLMPRLLALSYIRDLYADSLKIVGSPLNHEGLRLITLKNQEPQLIEKFNRGLQMLKSNKEEEFLLKKWWLQ